MEKSLNVAKLIGCQLDTNQIVSPILENEEQIITYLNRITQTYGEDMLDMMKVALWGTRLTFSSYSRIGLSLREYLTSGIVAY